MQGPRACHQPTGRALPRLLSHPLLPFARQLPRRCVAHRCHNNALQLPRERPEPLSPVMSTHQPRLLLLLLRPYCCLQTISRDVGQGEAGRGERPEAIRT